MGLLFLPTSLHNHPRTFRIFFLWGNILYNIVSERGAHLTAEEVWEWVYDYWIHWSYHIPYRSEATCLMEH